MWRSKLLPAIGMMIVSIGCGGATLENWDMPTASGSMTFSQVTGTGPFANTFLPTRGSLYSSTGPAPSWGGTVRARLQGPVKYIQDLHFHFEGAATPGSTFTVGGTESNTLSFSDLINENNVLNNFTGRAGTVHIDSVVGTTYTCTLANVQFLGPNGSTSTLNGTISIDFTFGT